jgi:hypothetical protein
MKAVRRDNDLHFITKWLQLNNGATTPEEMLENQAAHELISLRERITRPTKSRLRHSEYLKRWNPPEPAKFAALADDIATLQFGQDYRAWIGRTFVSDILRGLEATH